MVRGVLISRGGELETINVNCPEDVLYKRCGFKTGANFTAHGHWATADGNTIVVHAKAVGKANTENKTELPNPFENTLFFGKVLMVHKNAAGELVDLSLEAWQKFYSEKMGGVEDIGSEDETRSIEDEVYPDDEYDENGYHVKGEDDGFIAPDEELEEEPYE